MAPTSSVARCCGALQVTRQGSPGWIVCQVMDGPPDPRSAAQGITMRLKCTKKLDDRMPEELVGDSDRAVAFTLDNYGRRWCLLDTMIAG